MTMGFSCPECGTYQGMYQQAENEKRSLLEENNNLKQQLHIATTEVIAERDMLLLKNQQLKEQNKNLSKVCSYSDEEATELLRKASVSIRQLLGLLECGTENGKHRSLTELVEDGDQYALVWFSIKNYLEAE